MAASLQPLSLNTDQSSQVKSIGFTENGANFNAHEILATKYIYKDSADAKGENDEEDGIATLKSQRENLQSLLDAKTHSPHPTPKKRPRGKSDLLRSLQPILPSIDRLKTNLIFDTNCFIDNLDIIERSFGSHGWNLLVPLAVVMELDGLNCGSTAKSKAAANALCFIEENLDSSKKQDGIHSSLLKVLTLRGDTHKNLQFRTESYMLHDKEMYSVDDVILETCVQYRNKHPCETADSSHNVATAISPVILVTQDRNLRIKASTRNLPCLDLKQWLVCSKKGGPKIS